MDKLSLNRYKLLYKIKYYTCKHRHQKRTKLMVIFARGEQWMHLARLPITR